MFGREILVSCAFPPSLPSGVNITRDVNLLSRTCIVMYYFAMYTRLTSSSLRTDVAFPAYLGLGII